MIRSLRTRLLLLVAIAVLPALAMIVYAGVENRRLAARAAQERALHLANLAALQQNQIVEATRQLLAGLAQLPAVRGLAPGPCSALMAEVQKQFPSYANMGAIRPDGELVCSAVPLPGPLNVADRSYFRRALETREFAVSEFLIGRVTQKPSLTFAYPALDRRREVEAVLFAAVDLRWLNHLAADALLPRGSTLTVVDQEGRVLARHPQGEAWIGKVVAGMPMVQAILTGRPEGTGEAAGLDGVPRLYGFARLPLPPGAGRLYIAVAIPTSEALAAANRALGAHLGGFAVVALLALAAALVGGHRLVVRPAVAVTAAASRVAAGDLGARTGLPHDEGELGQLARAFDEMAGALERRTGELRNAEARYRALVEQTLTGVYMFSADGIEYFNRAGAALFGYEVGEIVGRLKPTDLVHPEDRPLVARHIEARLGGAAETARYEFRGRRKNGSPLHCEVFGRRVLLDGRPVVLGVLIDITERKEAEAELRRVNRALRVLSQCNQALVRATDEADLPLAICRTVVEAGGYRFAWVGLADAERGAAVRPVAHAGHEAGYLGDLEGGGADPERTGDPVVAALRSVRPCVVSNIREHPGADLWRAEALRRDYASLIALPLVGEDRAFGVLAIYAAEPDAFQEQEVVLLRELAEDLAYGIVTLRARAERQRTEAELQRQREMLYQTEKLASMSQLRAGVAHELNNPLSVMIGRAGLLRQQVGEGPLAGQAEQIAEAAERCARIVRNFLALARQRPPERQRVLLNQVVREAVELLGYQLRVDSVEVELALAEELPALWADPHQLHQVVVNLVSNAHQAMRAGAGPRRLTLATRAEAGAGRVVLEVNDTGPGIPPEIQARIFEPFFTTKPPGQGTGLGLSLCQSIVEGHGGAIRVESRPGGGARFTVELPVEAPQRADQARVAEQWTPVRNKDVLVVDDEADLADLLADILSADGHRVDTASNGAVALSKLRERVYDLILTDLRMPDMDGPAFYRELERSHPDLARRVVFMTGDVHTASVREFLETAAAPTLAKPFEPDEVRRVAARVLRARAQTGR